MDSMGKEISLPVFNGTISKCWKSSMFVSEKQISSRERSHIPPGEKETHLLKSAGWKGIKLYVSFQEGNILIMDLLGGSPQDL